MSKKCWCSCSGSSCQARGFPDSWIDLPKYVLWSKHGIWCHDGRSPFIVGIQKSLFSKGFIFPFFHFSLSSEHWPIYSTFKDGTSFPAKSPLCGISFDWTAELCCRERKCSSQLGCSPGWVIQISEPCELSWLVQCLVAWFPSGIFNLYI